MMMVVAQGRSDARITAAVQERLDAGVGVGEVATWLVGAHGDLHPVALMKILCDASGEDLETVKRLVHERLPGPARVQAEALWKAAEMIWSRELDIAD
jgi:hypothetical protein